MHQSKQSIYPNGIYLCSSQSIYLSIHASSIQPILSIRTVSIYASANQTTYLSIFIIPYVDYCCLDLDHWAPLKGQKIKARGISGITENWWRGILGNNKNLPAFESSFKTSVLSFSALLSGSSSRSSSLFWFLLLIRHGCSRSVRFLLPTCWCRWRWAHQWPRGHLFLPRS